MTLCGAVSIVTLRATASAFEVADLSQDRGCPLGSLAPAAVFVGLLFEQVDPGCGGDR
jgi:hypothetical protein